MTNPCPHSATAQALFEERAKFGAKKYGITVSEAQYSQDRLLQHMMEEMADMLVYAAGLRAALARVPSADSPMRARIVEAITAQVGNLCFQDTGSCSVKGGCTCTRQIDAVMAVIEGNRT